VEIGKGVNKAQNKPRQETWTLLAAIAARMHRTLPAIVWEFVVDKTEIFFSSAKQKIFFIIKPRDALISQIYFVYKINLYMFRAVPLPLIRNSLTVHLALVYVIQVWRQLSSRAGILALLESCLQTCMAYTSAKCTVNELLMMGRGTARNM